MSSIVTLRLGNTAEHGAFDVSAAVHEIYSELRDCHRVIAVVPPDADGAVAKLASALETSGVPARSFQPSTSDPRGELRDPIDRHWIRSLFLDTSVLIVPGPILNPRDSGAPDMNAESYANRTLRIVLLGLGTVGLGVYRHLTARSDLFEVQRIVVRDPHKHEDDGVPPGLFSINVWDAVNESADLVIEAIGGIAPAADVVQAALLRGRAVITANKALVASRWQSLRKFAEGPHPRLHYSAAVGGAVPMLEAVTALRRTSAPIQRLRGVINGTCNFVLDRMADGASLAGAIAEAQARGFAEADTEADLSGTDAAQKLCLLARAAFGLPLNPEEIDSSGITHLTNVDLERARAVSGVIRLVAQCRRDGEALRASVKVDTLEATDYLSATRAEENRIEIFTENQPPLRLRGKGAGRWPTALAVMGDVYDVLRARALAAPALARVGLNR